MRDHDYLAIGLHRARHTACWNSPRGISERTRTDPALSDAIIPDEAIDRRLADDLVRKQNAELDRLATHDGSIARRASASLSRINVLAQQHGARLVVVTMPVSPALAAMAPEAMSAEMALTSNLDRGLAAEGVLFVNDMTDTPFSADRTNFRDADHLNHTGGTRYSRDLAERLATLGILPRPTCALSGTGA